MKTFMRIWGCIIIILGVTLIYFTAVMGLYALTLLNLVMLGLGLYGCWNFIQITEKKGNHEKINYRG